MFTPFAEVMAAMKEHQLGNAVGLAEPTSSSSSSSGSSSTAQSTLVTVNPGGQQSWESNGGSSTEQMDARGGEMRNGPYVDRATSKNVTALLGKTAYLNCRVKNLGNKTVSELPGACIILLSSSNLHLPPLYFTLYL